MANPNFYALKKKRQSPNHYSAEIDEYNNRQHMRCVETPNKVQGAGGAPGGPIAAEVGVSVLQAMPANERHAYQLFHNRNHKARQPLFDALYDIVKETAEKEKWVYRESESHSPLELLTNLLLNEFLHPAGYWKSHKLDDQGNPRPSVSVFAHAMHVERSTWRHPWFKRFMALRPILRDWRRHGFYAVNNSR